MDELGRSIFTCLVREAGREIDQVLCCAVVVFFCYGGGGGWNGYGAVSDDDVAETGMSAGTRHWRMGWGRREESYEEVVMGVDCSWFVRCLIAIVVCMWFVRCLPLAVCCASVSRDGMVRTRDGVGDTGVGGA